MWEIARTGATSHGKRPISDGPQRGGMGPHRRALHEKRETGEEALPSIGFHRKIRQKSLENTIYGVCAAERPNIVLKCLCIQLGSCHVAHTAYMGIFPA